MNYTKLQNTYFAKPKDDPKDRIDLEVGDSKQSEFFPQQKIMRWDNECNVSLRLVHDEVSPTVSKVGEKIKWQGEKVEADIYAIEEGQEFEIVLKEKPLTNKVQFTIQDKGVEYFYQPALTPEEIERGANRPENVVGSYAVYASENKVNYVGGKEYKTGKVGHIYRPRIEDLNGDWTWGELNIEKGLLTVTIPQEFLDKAVYPVRHAAGLTFGYTSVGANTGSWEPNFVAYTKGTGASGTAQSISAYFAPGGSNMKGLLAAKSTGVIISNGVTDAVLTN
jgi:ASC-1-like (ASCH) protein